MDSSPPTPWSFLNSLRQPNGTFLFGEKPRLTTSFLNLAQFEPPKTSTSFDPNIEESYQKEVKKQGEYYKGEDHLIQSAADGDTAMCRYLIAFHGVDPFHEVPESFQRAITVAMEHGHRLTVNYLHEKMQSHLPTFSKSIEERFSNEKVSKGEAYHPNFHLFQVCTYDDLEMACFLLSKNFADPLLVVGKDQHGMYGFREGDSAMIVAKRYGSKTIVDFLKEQGVPNDAPPEWIAPLHVKVEADERLMEVGALPGDREPLIFDVSADTTAEELKEMIVARLCEPGQKKSLFPVKRKQIDAIEMAEFSFEETNSSSSSIQHEQEEEGDPSKIPPKASRQEERVQKIISDWKLIELDEGKPIWHRGREMSSSEIVQKYCDRSCGLFLAFKIPLPQFKFVVNYPNSALVIPGEEYKMYVDCFNPEDGMKPSALVGRLQLIIVGELELVQCQEISVEMRRSEEGPEGRYVARWVPEHPGLHFAMTRANGVNVHEKWAELCINEDKGITSVRRKMASFLA